MDVKKRLRVQETGLGGLTLPNEDDADDSGLNGGHSTPSPSQITITGALRWLSGTWHPAGALADEDLDQIEADETREDVKRKGKALGLPEIDRDALPSTMVQKYLILDCMHPFTKSTAIFLRCCVLKQNLS